MWASWLHQKLENYEVPDELVGKENDRGDIIPERIFPVFRDEDELPANADLASPIYTALDQSKLLLVLCSPRARQSLYVNNEIIYYKKIGRSDRILAALIDGVPNSASNGGSETDECFPEALMHPIDDQGLLIREEHAEPIAADFRLPDQTQGWTSPEAYRQELVNMRLPKDQIQAAVARYQKTCELAFLKIVAGVLGVPLGTLTMRDAKYQLEKANRRAKILRRVAMSMAFLAIAALSAGGIAWFQWQESQKRREEALQQREIAQQRTVIAEERRLEAEQARQQASTAQTKAEDSEKKALANWETAKDEQYLSGLRFAREALTDNRNDLARATLLGLPRDRRSLEWDMLTEWAGSPAYKFDGNKDPGTLYNGSARIKTELSAMWRKIRAIEAQEATDDDLQTAVSPLKNVAAIFERSRGRQPTSLGIYRFGFAEPLCTLQTENYGSINAAVFSSDGTLLMVSMSAIRGVSTEPLGPPAQPQEDGSISGDYFIIPVPNCVTLGKAKSKITNAEEWFNHPWSDSGRTEISGVAWKNYGLEIQSAFLEDEDWSYQRASASWDLAPGKSGLISPSSEDDASSSTMATHLMAPSIIQKNSETIMASYGKAHVFLSTLWEHPDGSIIGIYHVLGSSFAGDVWNVSTGKKIQRVGAGAANSEYSDEVAFMFRDYGGAFSADGKYVLICPVKPPAGFTIEGEDGPVKPETALAIYRLSDGALVTPLENISAHDTARNADPRFEFSPDGKKVTYSSYEGADPFNFISTFDATTGKYLEKESAILSYCGFTPDGAWRVTAPMDADTVVLESLNQTGVTKQLQGLVSPTVGPAHEQLAMARHEKSKRFRLGRYLFKDGMSEPMIDMDFVATTKDMERWALKAGGRRVVVLRGELGKSLRSGDVSQLTLAEIMLRDTIEAQPPK